MFYIIIVVSLIIIFLLAVAAKVHLAPTTIWCKSTTSLEGKTAIITGANRGIGYATALDLARRGARVILACRSERRGKEARKKIVNESGNQNIVLEIVDLSSFRSVRSFARKINKMEKRLDILVNNAAIILVKFKQTVDRHQTVMQTNYFSHFLLTNLLIGLMMKTKGSRIVNVVSDAAKEASNFTLQKLDQPLSHEGYECSKLCNILFTIELAKKLKDSQVTTYAVRPDGLVETDILRHLAPRERAFTDFMARMCYMLLKTPEEAAQTIIYCCVENGIECYSGELIDNCRKVKHYKTASDPDLPTQLWQVTKNIVKLTPEEDPFGYVTALDFAKKGARVILACRDGKRAEEAREKIVQQTGSNNVLVRLVDMDSFKSVREFAKKINETEERLDILVNNAGAGGIGDVKSKDDHVLLMQVNYFLPFLLTLLPIDLMKKTKNSRVVNVSSSVANFARNFDVKTVDKYPGLLAVYHHSKLCNILFTIKLAKKLEGTGVTTYSLHPGAIKTEFLRHFKGVLGLVLITMRNLFFKTSEEGAQTKIYCSVEKGIVQCNGQHFENVRKRPHYKTGLSKIDQTKKLWEVTEEIVQVRPQENSL